MKPASSSRREFLQAAAAAGTLASVPYVHAGGSDIIRVGLIGCGDRGTGAATQALAADSQVKLVAMADAFEDRLEKSLSILKQDEKVSSKVDVAADRRFAGFDAYEKLLGQRRRRGSALHPAPVPAAAPPGRRRRRQACVRREAGRRRCAGSSLRTRELQAGQNQEPVDRLRTLPAVRQRVPRDRPTPARRRGRRDHHAHGQ